MVLGYYILNISAGRCWGVRRAYFSDVDGRCFDACSDVTSSFRGS